MAAIVRPAVGRSIDPPRGPGKVTGRALRRRPRRCRDAVRRHRPQPGPARPHPRHRLRSGHPLGRVHHRHRRRHARPQPRHADRRRPAVPRRGGHQSSRRTDRAARARDRVLVEEARRHVPSCRPTAGVFTIDEALAQAAVIWGTDNIFKSYTVSRGDVDAVPRRRPDRRRRVTRPARRNSSTSSRTACSRSRGPRAASRCGARCSARTTSTSALAPLFGSAGRQDPRRADGDRRRLRRQGRVSVDDRRPCGAAGVEVRAAGEDDLRPAEDMVATTKRHPSRTRHRTAIDADGTLLAMDIDFVIDGGAYCTLSPVVLSRGTIHAAGPTSARTCGSAAARSPPTRRRTAPSAASARRRPCSRSSGTWTGSRRPSGSSRRNCGAATSSDRARPAPSAR